MVFMFQRSRAMRKRGSLSIFAIAAACTVTVFLALTLGGVPGIRATQPSPATAAQKRATAIDAGLAKVKTVQGVMVFDTPPGSNGSLDRAFFAATSAGDRLVDVRYKPDWAQARKTYQTKLVAALSSSAANPRLARRSLEIYRHVLTRYVFIDSTATRTSASVALSSNVLTRKLALVHYVKLPWPIGLHNMVERVGASRVWTLSTKLQSALDDDSGVSAHETTWYNRPVVLVDVPATGGNPAWEATIDKEYGITLAVRIVTDGSNQMPESGARIRPFHVEKLRINQSLPPSTFTLPPDYSHASSAHGSASGAPKVVVIDLAKDSPVGSFFLPGKLAVTAAGTELMPDRVPAGYRLAEMTRQGGDQRDPLLLVYRRGISEFVVGSGFSDSGEVYSESGPSPASGLTAFDRDTWPQVIGNDFARIHGGALDGAPAAFFFGLYSWTGSRQVAIGGDLTRAELLMVAGSLRPLKSGVWNRPGADLASLIAIVVALVAVGVTLMAWFWVRHRREWADGPPLWTLRWPLVGLVLVIIGAGLDWHALLHNATGYGVRGWNEPLGRWVIALAVITVVGAAWRQLVTQWRGPIGPKLLAAILAVATLAGSVFALVYLPLEARFTLYNWGDSELDPHWLSRIFNSQASPSPTIGLYISIVGALVLLVGVIRMKRSEPIPPATILEPGDKPIELPIYRRPAPPGGGGMGYF